MALIVAEKNGFDATAYYFGCFALGFLVCAVVSKVGIQSRVRRLWSDGDNKAADCWHELELGPGDLLERNPCGSSTQSLDSIERIVRTGNYAFIYINAVAAHVVPRLKVLEGDFDAFLQELQEAWAEFHPDVALHPDPARPMQ